MNTLKRPNDNESKEPALKKIKTNDDEYNVRLMRLLEAIGNNPNVDILKEIQLFTFGRDSGRSLDFDYFLNISMLSSCLIKVQNLEYLLCVSQCESKEDSFFREYKKSVLDDEMIFVEKIIPMLIKK